MTRFFNFVLFAIFLTTACPAIAEDEPYDWQNGGTADENQKEESKRHEHGHDLSIEPLSPPPLNANRIMSAGGVAVALASVLCVTSTKCRNYITDRFKGEEVQPNAPSQPLTPRRSGGVTDSAVHQPTTPSQPSTPKQHAFNRVEYIQQATPKQCQDFARQAKAATRIRNWANVPEAKLATYIDKLKQIALESGYPLPGSPQ